MERAVLMISLFFWGIANTEAAVTCKNQKNDDVDWYILYKAPRVRNVKDKRIVGTGLEYRYIDSSGSAVVDGTVINDADGILANTLRPLFTPIRKMSSNIGFISYSDQPPGCSAKDTFGHSKGVLVVDKTSTGVWLLHSTPQFPYRRDQNHFWPPSGHENAQTFICVTFKYDMFKKIGEHLQYIRAFPFEHDIPEEFHQELKDAVNWEVKTAPNNFVVMTSDGGRNFHAAAKSRFDGDTAKDGDLYVAIAQLLGSDLDVHTWRCEEDPDGPYCGGLHKVLNIQTVISPGGSWEGPDHSKWCVAETDWACIGDLNRAHTQYKRPGGALCIQNQDVNTFFRAFVGKTSDCNDDFTNVDCNRKRKGLCLVEDIGTFIG
ncbi:deoxyribonuclease-2-alpha-like [Engraulis encrasicolus]|uniref:deoxyribonuclease-2-alpha-like n=1 Tax=Engraulis encrasicolus TaxID=184585 RepID=UPI002FD646A1